MDRKILDNWLHENMDDELRRMEEKIDNIENNFRTVLQEEMTQMVESELLQHLKNSASNQEVKKQWIGKEFLVGLIVVLAFFVGGGIGFGVSYLVQPSKQPANRQEQVKPQAPANQVENN